jgi:release factor glutamine methyltransferase
MQTVGALLAEHTLPASEARALLARVLCAPRERLIAHPESVVTPQARAEYMALVARRQTGEPLAYLLGEKEFYGRPFTVTPDVLVPRPDTETLIDVALACLRNRDAPRVLDLGTGSGCIAITLQLARPDARVLATDVSAAALAVARANARSLRADVTFQQGDWFAALGPGVTFDLIVSNPPYVAAADPHLDALGHEPSIALTDGGDGLRCLSILTGSARGYLREGAWLALEHGFDQAAAVRQHMEDAGFRDVTAHRDAGGQTRVTSGLA